MYTTIDGKKQLPTPEDGSICSLFKECIVESWRWGWSYDDYCEMATQWKVEGKPVKKVDYQLACKLLDERYTETIKLEQGITL
jgi:hypothetical protein